MTARRGRGSRSRPSRRGFVVRFPGKNGGRTVRIAQISPLHESVPPKLYGGTERVVHFLTEALIDLGHDVTLFASGDSQTRAELVAGAPSALRLDPNCKDPLAAHMNMFEQVF